MWQEFDQGIGDRLRCELPQPSSGTAAVSEPVNFERWTKNGVPISPHLLGRECLFAMAGAGVSRCARL
jgi:hypothetical protein